MTSGRTPFQYKKTQTSLVQYLINPIYTSTESLLESQTMELHQHQIRLAQM